MDILKRLAELHADRELINQAILTLERLGSGGAPRRGRPPKWITDQNSRRPKRRGRPLGRKGMSAVNRKAQSARMKKYWAARRKQEST